MKRLYCICIVASLLWQYEGEAWTTTTTTTTKPTTTTTTATTTIPTTTTTGGPGVNLKGKMVTLSQYSGITFYSPYYHFATTTTTSTYTTTTTTPTTTTPTTTTPRTTTTTPTTTTPRTTTTTPTTTTPRTTTTTPTTTTPRTTTTTPKTTTTTPTTTTTTSKTTTTTPKTTTTTPKTTTTTSKTTTTTPKTTTTTPKTTTTTSKTTTTTSKTTTTTPKTTTTTSKTTTTTRTTTTTTPKTTTTTPRTTTTTPKTTTTRTTTPRPTPATRGVTVCLRFMTDYNSLNLFKLGSGSPLTVSWSNPSGYTLAWNYYSAVSLNARFFLWSSVRPQTWTSVCVVLDSFKNVVQVFQDGSMSIRKIPPSRIVWLGEPVVDVSGFDGQVTDLEVWDYPIAYAQVFSYMQNYRSSGTVLTWSNIAYSYRGSVLFEDTYAQQQRQLINRQEQPIQIEHGRGQRLKYRKMFGSKRQRRRWMF